MHDLASKLRRRGRTLVDRIDGRCASKGDGYVWVPRLRGPGNEATRRLREMADREEDGRGE